MNQNIQPVEQRPKFSTAISSPTYQKLIASTLQDPARARRFVAAITSAVAVSPALQGCEAKTVIAGALLGESLNLSPSPQLGQYYLVPFKKKTKNPDGSYTEVTNATFVIGYRGLIQLAIRTGWYVDIDARPVHEGEYLGADPHTGRPVFNFSDDAEASPVVGYMSFFEYKNGFKKVLYWSKDKMLDHADRYSQAFSASDYKRYVNNEIPERDLWKYSSFWYKDFDAMACKTMIRQIISKWGLTSIEFQNVQKALDFDGRDVNITQPENTVDGGIFAPGDFGETLNELQEGQKEQIGGLLEDAANPAQPVPVEIPETAIRQKSAKAAQPLDMSKL